MNFGWAKPSPSHAESWALKLAASEDDGAYECGCSFLPLGLVTLFYLCLGVSSSLTLSSWLGHHLREHGLESPSYLTTRYVCTGAHESGLVVNWRRGRFGKEANITSRYTPGAYRKLYVLW